MQEQELKWFERDERGHPPLRPFPPPQVVAIVAMGTSSSDYTRECSIMGARHRIADETWGINSIGSIFSCDRVFMIDDIPNILAEVGKQNPACAGMYQFAKFHPGPIYTSKPYPEFPGTVRYPLEEVVNYLKAPYLKNTCAYAVAFAVWMRVPHLKLYGMDFTYPDRHEAEQGRANTEFMIAQHLCRGGVVHTAQNSTLLDTMMTWKEPGNQFYGYIDEFYMEDVRTADGVQFRIRTDVPEAAREQTLAEMQQDIARKVGDANNGANGSRRPQEGGDAVHLHGNGSAHGHHDRGRVEPGQHEVRPGG